MAAQGSPYNPLDKANLSESVVNALISRRVVPLADVPKFNGAGLYLIYYTGINKLFPPYEPLARIARQGSYSQPIYAGKAVPAEAAGASWTSMA